MKYGVNKLTLVGTMGDEPRVSERDGEAFVANCQDTKADGDPMKEETIKLILHKP